MSHEADLFARNPSTLAVSFCARVFVVIALGVGVGPRGQVAELWALSILLVNLYSPFLPKAARSLVEERFVRLGMGSTFSAMDPPPDRHLMTLLGEIWKAQDSLELVRLGNGLASDIEAAGSPIWESIGVVLTPKVVRAILEVEPLKASLANVLNEMGFIMPKKLEVREEVRTLAQRVSRVAESQAPTLGSQEDRWALALLLACWWLRRTVAELRTELPAAQTVFGVFDQKPQLMTFMASVSIVTGTPSDATAYAESFGALLKVWSVTELRLALQLPPVVAAKDAVVGRFGVAGGQDTEPILAHLITLGYSRDEALRALAGKA